MTAKSNTPNATRKAPRRLAMAAILGFLAPAGRGRGGQNAGAEGGQQEPQEVVVERTVIVKEDADANAVSGGSGDSGGGADDGQAGDRDGVYAVGDGGEVEFAREGNSLRLVEARPNPGWEPIVTDRGPEDISVEFRKGNVEWQFDAEIEDGGVLVVDPADRDVEGPEGFDD
jgi:hypothetical protein